MAHRIKITITRIRQRVIQYREPMLRQSCHLCQREVEMLTRVEAARILDMDYQMLALLIGDGTLHAIESVSGKIWVCKDSLFSRKR
jgi:hypothetical protein